MSKHHRMSDHDDDPDEARTSGPAAKKSMSGATLATTSSNTSTTTTTTTDPQQESRAQVHIVDVDVDGKQLATQGLHHSRSSQEDIKLMRPSSSGSSGPIRIPMPRASSGSGSDAGTLARDPSRARITSSAHDEQEEALEEASQIRSMTALKRVWTNELVWYSFGLLSGGALFLLAFWFPVPFIRRRYRMCGMDVAEYVLCIALHGGHQLCPVEEMSQVPLCERGDDQTMSYMLSSAATSMTASSIVPSSLLEHPERRMIVFRHSRFLYDVDRDAFVRIATLQSAPASLLRSRLSTGLTTQQHESLLERHGINAITIIVKSIPELLVQEIFHPFIIFQVYSVILWCFEDYFIFASAIFVIAAVSIYTTLMETRRRLFAIAQLARFECSVQVKRDGIMQTASSITLVPGDIIEICSGVVPCDVTLLSGGCVVNESMLTGESVPVVKAAVDLPYDSSHVPLGMDQRNTLFAATRVMQLKPQATGAPVLGVVVRGGFKTTKGSLILSILYPQPSSFKFQTQSFKFIAFLFCVALIGFGISVWKLTEIGAGGSTIAIRGLDLITIVVPPSLPLALSVGVNFALVALKKDLISCISPARINMAGKIRLMCFDKTGTLTSDGMEFHGCHPVVNGQFDAMQARSPQVPPSTPQLEPSHSHAHAHPHAHGLDDDIETSHAHAPLAADGDGDGDGDSTSVSSLSHRPSLFITNQLPISDPLLRAMSACHTLAVLEHDLIGDPLEVEMFRATRATMIDTGDLRGYVSQVTVPLSGGHHPAHLGVRYQFEFASALQRMSVVVVDQETQQTSCYVKGSPEMIQTLCVPDSIPPNYRAELSRLAHLGYRVLAIAEKKLPSLPQHPSKNEMRAAVECDLTLMGLIVLENKVKMESAPTLGILHDAMIRTVMVTGDNPLTAVTVAKECRLVPLGTRVYLGSLVTGADGETHVEWSDIDNEASKLDPLTLLPQHQHHVQGHYELAVTGPVFGHLMNMPDAPTRLSFAHKVLLSGVIFARMTPDQKAHLVATYQSLGLYTGMCGDGANDCGALKTAHVGVSLSESEASIAAPFTYQRPDISCIPILLAEGRSSLITSFQLFRYMAMYSSIQFMAVILCYMKGSVLGNWQYLFQDLIVVFPLTVLMGATPAARHLTNKRPSGNLLSLKNVSNLIWHVLICLGFQIWVFMQTRQQDGYEPLDTTPDFDNGPETWETTSLYYFSNFEYIVMACLFAVGRPWKKCWLANWKFTLWILVSILFSMLLLFQYTSGVFFTEQEINIPMSWRRRIFGYMLLNSVISILFEIIVFPSFMYAAKRYQYSGSGIGRVYGKTKHIEGSHVKRDKPYHVLRGEIEQAWSKQRLY